MKRSPSTTSSPVKVQSHDSAHSSSKTSTPLSRESSKTSLPLSRDEKSLKRKLDKLETRNQKKQKQKQADMDPINRLTTMLGAYMEFQMLGAMASKVSNSSNQ